MEKEGLELRRGVAEVIAAAKGQGVKLGFATTTGTETVDLILDGLGGALTRQDFAFVGDRDMVSRAKPSSEIYRLALSQLGVGPADAVAIEDTPESAKAALGAGLPCVGFPGEVARGRRFPEQVLHVVDRLEPIFCGIPRRAA